MAWCTNPNCLKDGLRKADVEFDETSRMILCHGCYVLVHPGWVPPSEYVDLSDAVPKVTAIQPRIGFAFQLTDGNGLKAQINYGGLSFAVMAPMDEIKRLFGG